MADLADHREKARRCPECCPAAAKHYRDYSAQLSDYAARISKQAADAMAVAEVYELGGGDG